MKEYLKIIDEIIALVGLHLIPKFVNLYQGQVDIRCEAVSYTHLTLPTT